MKYLQNRFTRAKKCSVYMSLCLIVKLKIHVYITQAQSADGPQKEEVKRSDIFGAILGEKDKQRSMRTGKVFPSSPTADIIYHNST